MNPEQGIESPEPMHPSLREVLLSVEWGTEAYPVELLDLHPNERRILAQVSEGRSLHEIARIEGISRSLAATKHLAAQGKQDAKEGLTSDVLSLSPLAQRVIVLNSLFGNTWNRGGNVITVLPEVVISNARQLDELLGEKWKRCPQLVRVPIDTLRERISNYDSSFSPNWRNSPVLLTQDPAIIEERTAIYNGWFGKAWQMKPVLLTNNPKTVISSARALKTVGITQENTSPGPYFGLLGTTVANKRRKAAFIRRELLEHQQIYIYEDKKPVSEIVRARQAQTDANKKIETQEIEEFKSFLRHLGARGLTFSTNSIKDWAQAHGYPKSTA